MKKNQFDDEQPIIGTYDLIFKDKCPTHPIITWKLLKTLAFHESDLNTYVEGGLFRTPNRLYYEYDGIDPNDPSDAIKTVHKILVTWWDEDSLTVIPEKDKILYVILAYKLKFYSVQQLVSISKNFEDFYQYFSPGLIMEVKRIAEMAKVL